MAQKTIQVADKPTLDEIKKEIGNIKNSIQDVATNALVTGMTHAKRFTSDAIFTVPNGITEIIMLGCGSGKGGYAGNFLLPTRYTVVPGEEINIVCGMDSTAGYKDTVITSPSLGTIKLLAGTISRSIENTILGIPLGIQGGKGGSGNYGTYAGGNGGHGGLYGIGGGGAGGSGYNTGNSSYYTGNAGEYPGGAGGGGYSSASHGSVASPHPFGNNAGKSASNPYGGQGGNGIYYGAGGGFAGSGSTPGAAGNPSSGMVQIEW